MSNTTAYRWSYVDVEAERLRQLRAQLAQETTRSRDLRGQAKALRRVHRTARIDVSVVTVPSRADAAELAEALESARRINERAESELSRAAAGVWSVPPGRSDPPAAPRAAVRDTVRVEEPAREDRSARVRAAALVEAEALLNRDGPACEPADLPVFAHRLEALRRAESPEAARTLLADLGVLVHRSVSRERAAARTAALRAGLLDRLEDAEPEDRQRLAAAVAEAPDPSVLQREVERAVGRADASRHRSVVAVRLMEVLRERDYAVGDGFADLLAGEGSVVVTFGAAAEASAEAAVPDGYGLRITLAADRPGLSATMVRAPEAGADDGIDDGTEDGRTSGPGEDRTAGPGEEETDSRVQRWFCDGQLPEIENAIREQGVDLDRTSVLPPGVVPTAVAPDAPWPETGRAHDDRPQPRRRRKNSSPARPAAYGQERQRER
ncbi:hypothetical protein ACIO8F_19020 [Streptomyces sp. NPDC087228]|uniref:hypothetical protein n=1 Tax=Streptomyces sp. NPDC087228 TaxID=3365772 RepID=UPI00381A97C0